MRLPWRRQPPTPQQRLLIAAGASPKQQGDCSLEIAHRTAQRDTAVLPAVLAEIEQLMTDAAHYDLVVAVLEKLQNLTSYRDGAFWLPEDVEQTLSERSLACWYAISAFWEAVAEWTSNHNGPLESGEAFRGIENEHLKQLVWSSNRILPSGDTIGLADAVLYEKSGGKPMLGYSHVDIALGMMRELG